MTRIKEAVAEVQEVARTDPVTAAAGAVRLIERLSTALEHVDSSSGALGSAVSRAIESLVPVISSASVSISDREKWLDRLYEAHAADQIPYIETSADFWGELCVTQELASAWADRMIGITRMALSPDKSLRGHYHGTSACLSVLLRAGRYEDIESVLAHTDFWHYKCYAVKALSAQGRHDDAIALAESLRGHWIPGGAVDRLCERILLEAGRVEEAYERFGLISHTQSTYLGTFRAVAKSYPSIPREQILSDLIELSPGYCVGCQYLGRQISRDLTEGLKRWDSSPSCAIRVAPRGKASTSVPQCRPTSLAASTANLRSTQPRLTCAVLRRNCAYQNTRCVQLRRSVSSPDR